MPLLPPKTQLPVRAIPLSAESLPEYLDASDLPILALNRHNGEWTLGQSMSEVGWLSLGG